MRFSLYGDKDVRMTPYEVFPAEGKWRKLLVDKEVVPGTDAGSLNPELVSGLLKYTSTVQKRTFQFADSEEEKLKLLRVMDSTGEITLAGLMVLGKYPQQDFPQCVIDVGVYPGTEKGVDETFRYADRLVCDGPLALSVEDAVSFTVKNLRTLRSVLRGKARDITEIPTEVLREAIANAAMHRDYSRFGLGRQIEVSVFSDRVEVTSPGGLPYGATEENILRGTSAPRNPTLANLLRLTPSPLTGSPVAENMGTGIPRMNHAMKEAGLPLPTYSDEPTQFVVTLDRHGLMTPEVTEQLSSIGVSTHPRDEKLIVAMLLQDRTLTINDLSSRLGIDDDQLENALRNLAAQDVILRNHDRVSLLRSTEVLATATDNQLQVLASLDTSTPRKAKELSKLTGLSLATLRPILRELVNRQLVIATAPPTSRNRAYLLPVKD